VTAPGDLIPRLARSVVLVAVITALASDQRSLATPTEVVGRIGVHFVTKGETLLDIARGHGLGILEVMTANPSVDPWIPPQGQLVILPLLRILPDAPREGVVINLAERRLYYYAGGSDDVRSWPIGIGRLGFKTPLGETRITRKKVDPTWYPTEETRADNPDLPQVVPAGPDNPMGRHALYLAWPQYAVHGTNQPWGIGRHVSRGCIRLYPEDIEALFGLTKIGTKVTVVDQPAKLAWSQGKLYLEIHPSRAQLDELEETGRFAAEPLDGLREMIEAAAGDHLNRLDPIAIARAERERRGIPQMITLP
jgi:L,D-transpeptidase ErfK/SrfK